MKKNQILFLSFLALAGIAAAVYGSLAGAFTTAELPPPNPPPASPYEKTLSVEGIIEPLGGQTGLFPFREDVIAEYFVKIGDHVKKGDRIFRLRTTGLETEKNVLEAELQSARANYEYLKEQPRPTDIPPLENELQMRQNELKRLRLQFERKQKLVASNAVSRSEFDDIQYQLMAQESSVRQAENTLAQLKAGVSQYKIAEAQAQVMMKQANVERVKTLIEESTVRAVADGVILRINKRVGEYVSLSDMTSFSGETPPVILGSSNLCIRVDIDETDTGFVHAGMQGTARLKQVGAKDIPIHFLRIEPMVVPKKNLTGLAEERVDVRVLQMLFTVDDPGFPIYPGQQVHVSLKLD